MILHRRIARRGLDLACAVAFTVTASHAATELAKGMPVAQWTKLSPATSPSARAAKASAYDAATGNFVIFGGQNGIKLLSDTWVLVPR